MARLQPAAQLHAWAGARVLLGMVQVVWCRCLLPLEHDQVHCLAVPGRLCPVLSTVPVLVAERAAQLRRQQWIRSSACLRSRHCIS